MHCLAQLPSIPWIWLRECRHITAIYPDDPARLHENRANRNLSLAIQPPGDKKISLVSGGTGKFCQSDSSPAMAAS